MTIVCDAPQLVPCLTNFCKYVQVQVAEPARRSNIQNHSQPKPPDDQMDHTVENLMIFGFLRNRPSSTLKSLPLIAAAVDANVAVVEALLVVDAAVGIIRCRCCRCCRRIIRNDCRSDILRMRLGGESWREWNSELEFDGVGGA